MYDGTTEPDDVAPGGDDERQQRLARTLSALADPDRMHLVRTVAAAPGAEACICDLAETMDAPTLTTHLTELVAAGIISTDTRRDGWVWLRVVPSRIAEAMAALGALLGPAARSRIAS